MKRGSNVKSSLKKHFEGLGKQFSKQIFGSQNGVFHSLGNFFLLQTKSPRNKALQVHPTFTEIFVTFTLVRRKTWSPDNIIIVYVGHKLLSPPHLIIFHVRLAETAAVWPEL